MNINIKIDSHLVGFIDWIKTQNENIKSDKKECEFEIRLTTDKKGLDKKLFDTLLSKLQETEPVFTRTLVEIYPNGIRKITEYDQTNQVPIKSFYQQKYGKQNIDKYYTDSHCPNYKLRYSFSVEESISVKERLHLESTRDRYRSEIQKNGYKYVFTKINPHSDISYELEIEFDMDKLSVDLVNESLTFLYTGLVSFGCEKNISDDMEKGIVEYMSENILKKIKIEKPVNIKHKLIDMIMRNDYQVTNKLDGERYYLFINDGYIYSVQNNRVLCLSKQDYKDLGMCLFDCELYGTKEKSYYLFDCYCFKSKLVDKEMLSNRLSYCETLKFPLIAGVKQFSKNLLDCTKHFLETLDRDENDGLIFTPENPNLGLKILKWKFPEKMSIDFRVIRSKSKHYDLYVTTPKGESVFKYGNSKAKYVSDIELKDEHIYEFLYDKKGFKLLRERADKEKPNFVKVALDVFEDMVRPFEDYELINILKPLYYYRKLHNRIKSGIIETYCKNKSILDLGIGRGGDLGKYERQNIVNLFGVEPNVSNGKEFLERLEEHSFIDKVKLIRAKAQDTKVIVKEVGVDGVDIVSSFFSLSFFFFNENDLDNLVQTISQNLKEDGLFIGTTIDGERTKLVSKSILFKGGFLKLNTDNTVTINIKDGIVGEQVESLVDFKLLESKLKEVGIHLVKSEFFEMDQKLTENENKLNSLYRTFVFKKENMMKKIKSISTKETISDLLVNSSDEKCFDMFRHQVNSSKKIELIQIDPSQLYKTLKSFYMYKKYIYPLESPYFRKEYTVFGDRINKTLVRQKIYNCTLFKDLKNKESFRNKLSDIISVLKHNNINYGDLENILVCNNNILFHNYSKMSLLSESTSQSTIDEEIFKKWFT